MGGCSNELCAPYALHYLRVVACIAGQGLHKLGEENLITVNMLGGFSGAHFGARHSEQDDLVSEFTSGSFDVLICGCQEPFSSGWRDLCQGLFGAFELLFGLIVGIKSGWAGFVSSFMFVAEYSIACAVCNGVWCKVLVTERV